MTLGLSLPDKLGTAYEQAWQEWASSGEAEVWEAVVGDGIGGHT